MKTEVDIDWVFGDRTIRLSVKVPAKQKRFTKQVLESIYGAYKTALKAYNIQIIKNTNKD